MSEKVILPKEVSVALSNAKEHYSKYDIIESLRHTRSINNENLRILSDWCGEDETTEREDIIITALVNGYTVEQTPEEAVLKLYQSYLNDGLQSEAVAIRVAFTKYGIKIEGINA